jgi:hypothetical protein
MNERARFLEVAHRIGLRLARQAQWNGSACTWNVIKEDHASPGASSSRVAGGSVYQGTAGIALFLSELYVRTEDPEIERAAIGAVQHALLEGREMGARRFGFHDGRVGIAFAATHAAESLGRPEFFREAEAILTPLRGNEQKDQGIDVISGAAGAIPALLQLAPVLPHEVTIDMARQLGDHLINVAHAEVRGWSWSTIRPTSVRNLVGLAHGASGCGHALLELFAATGEDQYLYAAEQAFLYERQFFDATEKNWPDFRNITLNELVRTGRHDELRSLLKAGKTFHRAIGTMRAWCHGAPGIGLTRLRAFELLAHPLYREEAEAAVETTLTTLDEDNPARALSNYSLCHGLCGNAETLLYAAQVLEQPHLRTEAEACGLRGWERVEREDQPWPSGAVGAAADPSLLLGEAGVGHFYLRLHSDEIPSVLLLKAPNIAVDLTQTSETDGSYRVLQRRYVRTFFGRTLDVLDSLSCDAGLNLTRAPLQIATKTSDVERSYSELEAIAVSGAHRALINDAFEPERKRYIASLSITDFTDELLSTLLRETLDERIWTSEPLQLAPHTHLVRTSRDWETWLAEDSTERSQEPQHIESTFLLYRSGNRILLRTLSPFAAAVLSTMEQPHSIEEITRHMTGAVEGPVDPEHVRLTVVAQVKQAWTAGLIVNVSPRAPPTYLDRSKRLHEELDVPNPYSKP